MVSTGAIQALIQNQGRRQPVPKRDPIADYEAKKKIDLKYDKLEADESGRPDPSKLDMARAALGGPDGGRKDSLWNLAVGFNTDASMLGAIKGPLTEFASNVTKGRVSPSMALYTSQIRGFASAIAKAMGEAGRLSDQDIERTVMMFPRPGDSPELTERKLQAVWDVMNSDPEAMRQYIKGRGVMPEPISMNLVGGNEDVKAELLAEYGER
jgi:hypothetical protein